MPQQDNAAIEVVAFDWVPPFARGQVRDLRVRWALEEAGLAYRTRLISARERPSDYYKEQPFGQVPAYHEGDVHMFECGAIALHIAGKPEAGDSLLPADAPGRARALTWLICALNSLDPYIMNMTTIDHFCAGQEWATLRRPAMLEMMERRLQQLSDALGDKDWLDGRFTVGDLLMVATLRGVSAARMAVPQNILDYVARGEARPAFQAAMAAHLADFLPDPVGVPA